MKRIASTGLILGAVLFCVTSCDQQQGAVEEARDINEQRAEDTAMEDQMEEQSEFLTKAASISMFEVRASELAQQKARNQEVKDFAQLMVNDHTKANEELRQLARQKNIVLPDSMGEDMMDNMKELREKTGNDFTNSYMEMMVNTHEDAVDRFEDASNNLQDVEIRNFANSTLPTLRQHLDRARQVRDRVNR